MENSSKSATRYPMLLTAVAHIISNYRHQAAPAQLDRDLAAVALDAVLNNQENLIVIGGQTAAQLLQEATETMVQSRIPVSASVMGRGILKSLQHQFHIGWLDAIYFVLHQAQQVKIAAHAAR